jgi:ABC-2 type transport system ATP-binding protein
MIEAIGLSKHYGSKRAVDDLSFVVRPGVVTGFLGPNGAGKSTTMRMLLGLDNPTSGTATINGSAYRSTRAPIHEVGALLEARAVHSGRSARNHLRAIAATVGIGKTRVDEVLAMVGLTEVANKRVGKFSLGMGQRLGLAAALLGDPQTLMLDEPTNGLDPDGIIWIRAMLKHLAAEGRTVFLSSHLMAEMALTADHVIIVGQGRLLRDQSMSDLIAQSSRQLVRLRSPQTEALTAALVAAGGRCTPLPDGAVEVEHLSAAAVGDLAAHGNHTLHELTPIEASLEEAYLAITQDARDVVAQ